MLVSVIIVSYEIKYFLEQCLFSVNAAICRLEKTHGQGQAEIIVVDNASTDGTIEFLQKQFPLVRLLSNKENIGFGRANNLAIQHAKGNFILFLNPDTIIPEPILSDCISFFGSHPAAGGIGVRMVDGAGKFLLESKRGFPTAWRSFCKLSGLSSLFPHSNAFAGYNAGHLNETGVFQVDALAGAFMMIRSEVLEKVGVFDERFFMYAEDIDLSKRIKDAGFENYYLGNHTILHFKGESTVKDRAYVKRFYGAMNLYVQKHYTGFGSRVSVGVMKLAITVRGMLAKAGGAEALSNLPHIEAVSFIGDKGEISYVEKNFKGIRSDLSAETLIICEGNTFSFSAVIETIQKLPGARRAMIHASGSYSIVGSWDKNKQGSVIVLTS
ncbi:MAG TPA: glycosyltransferase family 2 protein [Chitinophagaceae bacterium]|nr:glycosyltransferase family 2 protein [Chitinophagaceae bacterium]